MSKKEIFVQNFRRARTEHAKWLNRVKLMVTGIETVRNAIALNRAESAFGFWLFNEAMSFSNSASRGVLDEIDALHTECYDRFIVIYHLLHGESRSGLLGSLFGRRGGAGEQERALAHRYYEELVGRSDELMKRLRVFESQLLAAPESKFDALIVSVEGALDAPNVAIPDGVAAVPAYAGKPSYYRGQLVE